MNAEELSRLQRGVEKYWPVVRWVETTGSTNDDLLNKGEPGTVLIAGEQTASRGRLGRKWVSPKDAQLAMSMVLPIDDNPPPFGLLSIAPGVAVTDVVPQAQLKWPNDVQIGGKKLAGILSGLADGRVVVGIGINVNFEREQLPIPTATALNLEGIDVDFVDFTTQVLCAMGERFAQWQQRDPQLLADYRKVCSTIGQHVRIELHDGEAIGTVDGVNDEGEVIIDGTAYSVGDVHHLRPKQ